MFCKKFTIKLYIDKFLICMFQIDFVKGSRQKSSFFNGPTIQRGRGGGVKALMACPLKKDF